MKHEQLNKYLHEKLFGACWCEYYGSPRCRKCGKFDGVKPDYAGNIADAFKVVEKMKEKYDLDLALFTGNRRAYFYTEKKSVWTFFIEKSADTHAEAICLAAKSALESLESEK